MPTKNIGSEIAKTIPMVLLATNMPALVVAIIAKSNSIIFLYFLFDIKWCLVVWYIVQPVSSIDI